MPRFYFHLDDGTRTMPDPEGMVLPDAEAAWYQGVRSARALLELQFGDGSLSPGQRLQIVDEQGLPVWAVPFDEVAGFAM